MPLRQLYPDPKAAENHAPPAMIDIVAVPGLGPPAKGEAKHAFDTWRTPSGQKGRLWLQQDLPGHIPDSRIFIYQYNTTAAYCQGLDDFRSKADNLLEVINIERRECPERPILLLGRSMGGLLIKQALMNAHSNPGYSAIKAATTGIIFFGTPHELVTQKLGEVSTAIARELGHEPRGDLVVSLQNGSAFSELESWKHQALEYDTVSFWGSSDTGMLSEAQDKLYSRMPFEMLILQEPVVQGIRYLNYQKPTNVQEAVLSALTLHPPRNVFASYPPGTGKTTALAIAVLSRTPYFSTTQPQVLAIVPTRLLVRQTEKYIKEVGRFCEGLVIETITASNKPTAKVEANVIIATPGSLLDSIRRRLVDTSQVRFLLMDDIDYLVDLQGLSQQCIQIARKSPGIIQFLLFSDLSTRASDFVDDMLRSSTCEKHQLRAVELNAYKIVHLFFRCSGKQEKLDIICKLPGVATTSTLIIFVQTKSSAWHVHLALATEGHAVANLLEADKSEGIEKLLKRFHDGEFKVLITKDCKTRGLDLPSSSMVINYDIPDADVCRYLRQVSRASKAGRSGFAVNLVSDEKEKEALESVAISQGFNIRELKSDD
ncbi:hypothetical protein H9Q70_006690 [Fusarium xylarioides]|nr:hypothetical protein H9Q70_006690 [Fusarium xylarioides]